jgi:hypothetical protein
MDFYIQHLARIKSIFTMLGCVHKVSAPSPGAWHDRRSREAILQWP